jgi:hypothetical protein
MTNDEQKVLDYLEHRLPDFPFNQEIDTAYVEELFEDFPKIHILGEIKTLRWYHNNNPFRNVEKPRLALRRWLSQAWSR